MTPDQFRDHVTELGVLADLQQIARKHGLSRVEALCTHTRVRNISHARGDACLFLCERFPSLSYPALGKMLGGFDHTSILRAVRAARERRTAGHPKENA